MKYLARKLVERAIRDLKMILNPRAPGISVETEQKQITHSLHAIKDLIDTATKDINGQTSAEHTKTHQQTEEMSDKLLNKYYMHGDAESIRALASRLIAKLSVTQAHEYYEELQEQYKQCIKGDE